MSNQKYNRQNADSGLIAKRQTNNDKNVITSADVFTEESLENLCVDCGAKMGWDNPRQYCGKVYCTQNLFFLK